MGSVAHVEEEMKQLVKDIYRLSHFGVCLMSISNSGVTIENGKESSLVVEVHDVRVEILDCQVRRLRNKEVASVKVMWRSQSVEGYTWEEASTMKAKYPHLFPSDSTPA